MFGSGYFAQPYCAQSYPADTGEIVTFPPIVQTTLEDGNPTLAIMDGNVERGMRGSNATLAMGDGNAALTVRDGNPTYGVEFNG
jgi:hypothetical protein